MSAPQQPLQQQPAVQEQKKDDLLDKGKCSVCGIFVGSSSVSPWLAVI
jgi:hypothetical protein